MDNSCIFSIIAYHDWREVLGAEENCQYLKAAWLVFFEGNACVATGGQEPSVVGGGKHQRHTLPRPRQRGLPSVHCREGGGGPAEAFHGERSADSVGSEGNGTQSKGLGGGPLTPQGRKKAASRGA
jgi:hypothetical protein